MTFGDALEKAKAGRHIKRIAWKNLQVFAEYTSDMQEYLVRQEAGRDAVPYLPDGDDLFSDDWTVI